MKSASGFGRNVGAIGARTNRYAAVRSAATKFRRTDYRYVSISDGGTHEALGEACCSGNYCSGFHDGGSKRRSYYPEQLLSDEPEYHPRLGRLAVGGSSQPVGPLLAEPLGVLSLSPLICIPAVLTVLLSW